MKTTIEREEEIEEEIEYIRKEIAGLEQELERSQLKLETTTLELATHPNRRFSVRYSHFSEVEGYVVEETVALGPRMSEVKKIVLTVHGRGDGVLALAEAVAEDLSARAMRAATCEGEDG